MEAKMAEVAAAKEAKDAKQAEKKAEKEKLADLKARAKALTKEEKERMVESKYENLLKVSEPEAAKKEIMKGLKLKDWVEMLSV